MKNAFLKSAVLLVTLMTILSSTAYAADRDNRNSRGTNFKVDRQTNASPQHRLNNRDRVDRSAPQLKLNNRDRVERSAPQIRLDKRDRQNHSAPQYRLDKRYNHNRSYPREGHIVRMSPNRYRPIHYHNRDYFYISGVWHLSSGANLVVTRPPFGIVVSVLPAYYSTIWFRSTPYYYADDVYYVWRPELSGYQVTTPPTENAQPETTPLEDEVFSYPKQGQSEEQQADDRYACHRWGFEQTGYDPSQPPENLSMDELSRKRQDYRRAMKTCLEGKNYSVN